MSILSRFIVISFNNNKQHLSTWTEYYSNSKVVKYNRIMAMISKITRKLSYY